MAISSYNAKLMHGTGETPTWEQLIPVKTTPQLGGAPEMLETTTLDDAMQTYINGIQSSEAMSFTANYDSDKYDELKLLENKTEKYAVWFGNDGNGSAGKFKFEGQLSVFVNETSVNGVVEMTITIVPSTPITKDVA
jgi:hypothetical protein